MEEKVDPDVGDGNAIIGILSLFVIILTGGFIWFIIELIYYDNCVNSESVSCPVFYCPNQINGNSGTECYDITSDTGEKVPWRFDENGKKMCQKSQYMSIDQPGYNRADYPP